MSAKTYHIACIKEVTNIQIKHNMKTPYSEGIIEGLDLAIEQLQTDIKYLKEDK